MNADPRHRPHLADLPRSLPPGLGLRLTLGGVGQLGWLIFGFGLIFGRVFLPAMSLDWWLFRGELELAKGKVIHVEETSFSENGRRVFFHEFDYDHGGVAYTGECYGAGRAIEPGRAVAVEVVPGLPERARIQGMKTRPFSFWVVFVAIFPLAGFLLIVYRFFRGRKLRHLLRHGYLGHARLLKKEPTSTRINELAVWRYVFEYEAEGGHYEKVVKTHHPWDIDDERETLLYDPVAPERASLLGYLPSEIGLDSGGQVVGKPGGKRYLILPAIVVLAHGLWWWLAR